MAADSTVAAHPSNPPSSATAAVAAPLLQEDDIVPGSVDHRGFRIRRRSGFGGWRSAAFIVAVEVAERFAYFGISANLITYLTGPLGQSTAAAAANVNAWAGTATLLPVVGAVVADSFLGRYTTIFVASVIYTVALGLLTLSAAVTSATATKTQEVLFFISLYLVAIGQGGHKPCVQAFGADQFDELHPKESKAKSSFFNYWYCSMAIGINVALLVVVYVQDNVNWAVGFGIPCLAMAVALFTFLLGRSTYRFSSKTMERNPFLRIGHVIVSAFGSHGSSSSKVSASGVTTSDEVEAYLSSQSSHQFKFLNKALFIPRDDASSKEEEEEEQLQQVCTTVTDVEMTKQLLRLVPIWLSILAYAVVYAQTTTFFTKQGASMDRTISPNFQIPPASLQFFLGAAIIIFIPLYDRVFVPIASSLTLNPTGITTLQRMGTGMFLSMVSMVVSAVIEAKRLRMAHDQDEASVSVPVMSIWWLVPQYVACGVSDVFTIVGLQEFFYEEVPKELKSLGLSFYLGVLGVGSFLSGFLVSLIDEMTGGEEGGNYKGWFADDLDEGHLDYFYWLLAGLNGVWLVGYLWFARSYVYREK